MPLWPFGMLTKETPGLGRVLVVDDEENIRKIVRLTLTKAGYGVEEAEDGGKAIEVLNTGENPLMVDVIICDIRMPHMSGIELLGRLKEIDPGVEVIMLTAYETLDTAREALRLGACDYLGKPHSIEGMREAVTKAMSRRAVTREIRNYDRRLRELQRESDIGSSRVGWLSQPTAHRHAFERQRSVTALPQAATRAMSLPKLRPSSIPMKAPGAFSRPSTTSSR